MKRLILLTALLAPGALRSLEEAFTPAQPSSSGSSCKATTVSLETGSAIPEQDNHLLRGYPMSTPDRAREETERVLRAQISRWLASSGVPETWRVPDALLDRVATRQPVQRLSKDYGDVFVQPVAFGRDEPSRELLLHAYQNELATRRLGFLGGALAFVLANLAVLRTYIRLDEKSKGYYTNRLRFAGTVIIAAAGAAIYMLLV